VLTRETLPGLVRAVVEGLRARLLEVDRRSTQSDHRVEQLAKQNEATRRVRQGEGVGPSTATAGGPDWRRPRLPTRAAVRGLGGSSP
jgi:hypothetical protein